MEIFLLIFLSVRFTFWFWVNGSIRERELTDRLRIQVVNGYFCQFRANVILVSFLYSLLILILIVCMQNSSNDYSLCSLRILILSWGIDERERVLTTRLGIQVVFDYICQFRVNAILASNFFIFVTDFDSYWQCMENSSIDFCFCSFTGGAQRERWWIDQGFKFRLLILAIPVSFSVFL